MVCVCVGVLLQRVWADATAATQATAATAALYAEPLRPAAASTGGACCRPAPQASNKELVGAYTRLYQLLLASGYSSWEDYVLDQLLLGRENPFARAVAQVGPRQRWGLGLGFGV